MPLQRVAKHEVAAELLDRAMRLYLQHDSYFAAIHLAGAAEEVLAVYARSHGLVPAYDSTKTAIVALAPGRPGLELVKDEDREVANLLNEAKNSVKHKKGKADDWIEIDPREEAGELIERALLTLFQLPPSLGLRTPELTALFHEERHGPAPSEA